MEPGSEQTKRDANVPRELDNVMFDSGHAATQNLISATKRLCEVGMAALEHKVGVWSLDLHTPPHLIWNCCRCGCPCCIYLPNRIGTLWFAVLVYCEGTFCGEPYQEHLPVPEDTA